MDTKNITVIGTGAYGTVLANVLADSGHNVVMYGIEEQQVDDLNLRHENTTFFKDLKINEKIKATLDLQVALENSQYLVLGVPTKAIKPTLIKIKELLKTDVVVINTAKGIDEQNLDLLSKMIVNEMQDNPHFKGYTALYGPSVAIEIIHRKPAIVNVAGHNEDLVKAVCSLFQTEYFFAKPSDDLIGCELSAALKNVIAILGGMLYEMQLGDNAHATLLTIGLNEIYQVAKHFGAKVETFLNFATMGDLVLTGSSTKSRNFTFGRKIIEFNSAKKAKEAYNLTVEGALSAKTAFAICEKNQINSRLFKIAYDIIWLDKNPISLLEIIFNY
jgi:glycerol-3-phosphate dehydrogenase (NAD(P)+)